jgi:Alcohol dehydrogenase GroES-associated
MKAVVYHGPGHNAWEEVPDPEIIGDGDAIVRVDAATISDVRTVGPSNLLAAGDRLHSSWSEPSP